MSFRSVFTRFFVATSLTLTGSARSATADSVGVAVEPGSYQREALSNGLEFCDRAFSPSTFEVHRAAEKLIGWRGGILPPSSQRDAAEHLLSKLRKDRWSEFSGTKDAMFRLGLKKLLDHQIPAALSQPVVIGLVRRLPSRFLRSPRLWETIATALAEDVFTLRRQWKLDDKSISSFLLHASANELESAFQRMSSILTLQEAQGLIARYTTQDDPIKAFTEHALSLDQGRKREEAARSRQAILTESARALGLSLPLADEIAARLPDISQHDLQLLAEELRTLGSEQALRLIVPLSTHKDAVARIISAAQRDKELRAEAKYRTYVESNIKVQLEAAGLKDAFSIAYDAAHSPDPLATMHRLSATYVCLLETYKQTHPEMARWVAKYAYNEIDPPASARRFVELYDAVRAFAKDIETEILYFDMISWLRHESPLEQALRDLKRRKIPRRRQRRDDVRRPA
jgi:hypothetical protein